MIQERTEDGVYLGVQAIPSFTSNEFFLNLLVNFSEEKN